MCYNTTMEKGKFIVLEGTDGSGKSTHAKLLAAALEQRGIPTLHTFEPTDRPVGQLIRRYLKGDISTCERTIAGLFLSDRLDHITHPEGMLAQLERGVTVICDRYYYSSIAYNCGSESPEWVTQLNMAAKELLAPDLVIYLDLSPEAMEQRLQHRDYKEIYETVEYQRKVRARYLEALASLGDNVKIIPCDRSKQEVAQEVLSAALQLFSGTTMGE